NKETIAFRLTWNDPTEDAVETVDSVALLLKTPQSQGDMLSLQTWPYDGSPVLDICLWSAKTKEAVEAVAAGFKAVGTAAVRSQRESHAQYKDGQWRLLIQRPIEPPASERASALSQKGLTAIGFAVWDGAYSSTRAVSPWVELDLRNNVKSDE
ncbi:MAG: hypothetical protein HYU33_03860, partial [Candidatus Omnitrophica bacterium]|nr:hypothetical protein [Candidatus Omnitrophota bacterium]